MLVPEPELIGPNDIVGVVLAGGLSRRMDGVEKSFINLADKPMLQHVLERFTPQVENVIINANGDPQRFSDYDHPIVADPLPDYAGPLAGVLAALDWAATHHPNSQFVVSVAADAPFLPANLVQQFLRVVADLGPELICAASYGRPHPVVGLWPVHLREELRRAVVEKGVRKVDLWTIRYRLAYVEFNNDIGDPFFNVNRPEDLIEAERLLAMGL